VAPVQVVHNGMADLLFLFHAFYAPLPARLDDFAFMAHEWLPVVYDTKQLRAMTTGTEAITHLGYLYHKLSATALQLWLVHRTSTAQRVRTLRLPMHGWLRGGIRGITRRPPIRRERSNDSFVRADDEHLGSVVLRGDTRPPFPSSLPSLPLGPTCAGNARLTLPWYGSGTARTKGVLHV